MPRIKLVPLDHYQHRYETMVEVTDLNYGNHLGNDSLVGIIHRARVHFFHQLGVSEKDLGDATTGVVLTDLVVNYKAEGTLFDRLVVESSISELHARGFRMFHRVATKDNRLIALAEAGIIAFDYKKRKLAKLPEYFLSSCAGLMIS